MKKDPGTPVKVLFIIRILLWITAFGATVYWMGYSVKLHREEIFDPYEFAIRFRPVFYPCFLTAVIAIGLSFALYALGKRISRTGRKEQV
ncbi:MAG: hypothetical protein K6F53_00405 [Lachnospiraceae bacterium]|nr:hypothetical protein [Lachnospiraceae bacterium]